MTNLTKRIVQGVSVVFALLVLLLLIQIDTLIFTVTESLFPGAGGYTTAFVLLLEIGSCYALYRSFFARPSRLMLKANATEEERRAFAKELRARLAKNPLVRAANLSPEDPEFLTKAMAHLDSIADNEIRANGKKVLLGTALAQNGRLDALIVFFSLCRMVWRISIIYNQRPTVEEFWSVCSTVTSSTFVAFSIDALDIPQMITDTMNEMVPSVAPAVAANSVPFLGSCLHVFTESLIDGAANCLLAVRAGIITRRAYRYAIYGGQESLRRSCVRETGQMVLAITQESLGYIVSALRKEIQEVSVDTGKQFVRKTTEGVRSAAVAVGTGAGNAASAVRDGASYLLDGASLIKDGVSSAAGQVTDFVVDTAKQAVDKVTPKRTEPKKLDAALSEHAPAEISTEQVTTEEKPLNDPPEIPVAPPDTTNKSTRTLTKDAKNVAEKAVAAVSEGTGLIVDGVTSVAGQAASRVHSAGAHAVHYVGAKGKQLGGFFKEKKDKISGIFHK